MKKFLIILTVSVGIFACNSGGGEAKAPEVKPVDTPVAAKPILNEKGLELIGASDCTTCHMIDKKNIGPAYIDVSKKYEPTEEVIATLVKKIKTGGAGNWGPIPMTPHPDLPETDAREMVKYILSLKNQ